MSNLKIDRVVTAGVFELDGGTWELENNVWIVGNDKEVIIIDASHDAEKIKKMVGDRIVKAIICTHGHNDHINVAIELADTYNAKVYLNSKDDMLWKNIYTKGETYFPLEQLTDFEIAGTKLIFLETPGHTPGSTCIYLPEEGKVFTGDTLFPGGPGTTDKSYADFPTIIESIKTKLFTLPEETIVLPGHGDSTIIKAEKPHLDEWVKRGY